jgi:hypothetical protein
MPFFEGMNPSGHAVCPICGTRQEGDVFLCPIPDSEEGDIGRAHQIHRECGLTVLHSYQLALYGGSTVEGVKND